MKEQLHSMIGMILCSNIFISTWYSSKHPVWSSHQIFLRDKICDSKKHHVYCCGEDQTYPNDRELKILKGGDNPIHVNIYSQGPRKEFQTTGALSIF